MVSMSSRSVCLLQVVILAAYLCGCDGQGNKQPVANSFLGQTPPGITPVRFAEDIITDSFYPHSRMIISPGGDRIYWTTFLDLVSSDLALYYSDFNGENLSPAETETTLAKHGILSFIFSNDGNEVLFGSLRPYDDMDGRLVRAVWRCQRTGSIWSEPEPIEGTVDTNWVSLGSVSMNSLGDIYFTGRMEGETAKIYYAQFQNGTYQKYTPLPEIINTGIAIDPFIDYQDRYLLFAGANRDDNIGIVDLYVSYKDGGGNWSEPANLGQGISTEWIDRFPMVTRDGKYLFFVTSHSNHFPSTHTHFYWVDARVLGN